MSSRQQTASLAILGILAGAAVVACTAGDDFLPAYGVANGLAGKSPAEGAVSGDDGGAPTGCVAGETPALYVEAGTCSVSFSKDIEALMSSPTGWYCASSSCHGTGGTQTPPIVGNAAIDYPVLASYSTGFLRPYINPCSTDPAESSMSCNVTTGDSCLGETPMPETVPGNSKPTTAQLAMLKTWLSCGAPNN